MGVVNTKSTLITNADASPRVPNDPFFDGGGLRSVVGQCEVLAADSDTSTYRLFRLPSGARMNSLKVYCDAITGGTSYTVGLYDTAANGGAAVSAALFATALDLSSAITTGTEILFQNNDIDNASKRLWELLALSVDPYKEYDLVFVGTTVGTATGGITCSATYAL